jgi:hypothetical protein
VSQGRVPLSQTESAKDSGHYRRSPIIRAQMERKGRVFRFHADGWLREMLKDACSAAMVTLPTRLAFYVFRHNYGTWMRLYGGLDAIGLTRRGAWADLESVERYAHSEPTAESRRAALLPAPKRAG